MTKPPHDPADGKAGRNRPTGGKHATDGADRMPLVVSGLSEGNLNSGALQAIADALPTLIAFVDLDERYRFVNQPFADFIEQPREAIIGRTAREVLSEEAYQIRKPMTEAAYAGEAQWFAAEFPHPTRGNLAVQSQFVPQFDEQGAVSGILVLTKDVTEQRATERALRDSEARFRRIANSAPAMMWVTRLDRSRDFVNEAYVAFTGLPAEQARVLDWRALIHPDDAERVVAESIAGEASGAPFELEARYRRHDGVYRWLRSVSSPRLGADGGLRGFIGAASDITVAKEAELALKAQVEERTASLAMSEARFRAVFDTVLEVLVLLDIDGRIVELNRKQADWRYANPRESIGLPIWDSPTLKAYPHHVDLMKRAVATAARGVIFNEEVTMERPGVPTAFLDISLQPVIGDNGAIIFLLFEARDVTDLKAAQEQLRQAQKMEALGQLTGGIAHDFNNLLTVVVGGLDLITKQLEDGKLKRYATNALEAAERGARLTAQLLAFSRVQRLEVKPTMVAPLIENMRSMLRNVLGPGIDKKFDLDEAPIPVMADPTQLELAVLNLVINARDAMPDGGVLTIRTSKITAAGDPELEDGDYVELSISDTGTGMPPQVQARAFEPFFTTKEVGKGTGLGLSMVYGVARQSGGTARISSRAGEGTDVKLYFPHADPSLPGGDAAAVKDDPRGGAVDASILVIDDDPDVRGFIVATLDDLGYRVREAADGEAGLAEFKRDAPDLVVLDFIMPGLSGAEVARRMLARRPGQPLLFVSGYSETEAVREVAPDAPLLAKPFRGEALDHAIRAALAAQ